MTRHIIIPDVNYGESQLVAAREAMTVQTTRFMRRRILYSMEACRIARYDTIGV